MSDVQVCREGLSLFVVELLTEASRAWGHEHIPEDAAWLGPFSFACEHRYISDIVQGMQRDGLEVE